MPRLPHEGLEVFVGALEENFTFILRSLESRRIICIYLFIIICFLELNNTLQRCRLPAAGNYLKSQFYCTC